MDKEFWRLFIIVFVIAFSINTLIAYLWNIFLHNSSWRWDTTTTTAVMVGLVLAYILRRKKK